MQHTARCTCLARASSLLRSSSMNSAITFFFASWMFMVRTKWRGERQEESAGGAVERIYCYPHFVLIPASLRHWFLPAFDSFNRLRHGERGFPTAIVVVGIDLLGCFIVTCSQLTSLPHTCLTTNTRIQRPFLEVQPRCFISMCIGYIPRSQPKKPLKLVTGMETSVCLS